MAEGGHYVVLLGLALLIILVFVATRLLHRRRRALWRKVIARVDRAYYEVHGKNVFALIDLSWDDNGQRRVIKHVPTGRIDVDDTPMGDPVNILVHPGRKDRCVVDLQGD